MTDFIEHRGHQDNSPLKQSANRRYPQFKREKSLNTGSVDEVDNNDYRFEKVRLQSFENWPVSYMEPARLAAAGFYYTGESDRVRCFECKVGICQWLEGDDPMEDHIKWQEQCRFVRNIPCGNVPMGENSNSIPPPKPRSRDVCGPYADDSESSTSTDFQLPSSARLGSLGIGRPTGPSHPEYASYDARLATFKNWPKNIRQTKEILVDSGFYYTGKDDQTLCYYCGGGLKDWEPNDDPWEQHAKWFPKCCYLLTVKGQAYVNQVTGQIMAPPSTEETMQMNLPSYIKKVEPRVAMETGTKSEEVENASVAGPSTLGSSPVETVKPEKFEIAKAGITTETSVAENSKKLIDDARLCKICYAEELGVVFLPCGHMVACVKCAPGMTSCALCRQPVSMTVRAFFS